MGLKGDKHTRDAQSSADFLSEELSKLEDISSKKMFGGHGFFHQKRMFGMISSKGEIFFKTNDSNRKDYELVGAPKHSKMPYYSVPGKVLSSHDDLLEWARKSILASKK